jgi:hypothetical protein
MCVHTEPILCIHINQSYNGRSIVGKTVPCAFNFRIDLMTYFGSLDPRLDHKNKWLLTPF